MRWSDPENPGHPVHPFPRSSAGSARSGPASTTKGCSDASDATDQPDRFGTDHLWWRNEPGSCGELPLEANTLGSEAQAKPPAEPGRATRAVEAMRSSSTGCRISVNVGPVACKVPDNPSARLRTPTGIDSKSPFSPEADSWAPVLFS